MECASHLTISSLLRVVPASDIDEGKRMLVEVVKMLSVMSR